MLAYATQRTAQNRNAAHGKRNGLHASESKA